MTTYNIISKYPKGNQEHTEYIIKYQINNKPDIYQCKMFYMNIQGEPRYVFNGSYPHIGIVSKKESDSFIEEIAKFQKGGSYRKSNPIAYTRSQILEHRRKELMEEVGMLDRKIREERHKEQLDRVTDLVDKVDLKAIEKILDKIDKLFKDTDYKLVHDGHCYNDYTMLLIDKSINLPIIRIRFLDDRNTRVVFDHLQPNEIVEYTGKRDIF